MNEGPLVTFSFSDEDMSLGVMGLLEVLEILGVADVRGMDVETGAWLALKCPDMSTAEKVAAVMESWHLRATVVSGERGAR